MIASYVSVNMQSLCAHFQHNMFTLCNYFLNRTQICFISTQPYHGHKRHQKSNYRLLCPAVKRNVDKSTHTILVGILSYVSTQSHKELFQELGKEWKNLGGIPHWYKQWTFLEDIGIFEHIHECCGDNITNLGIFTGS